MSTLTATRTAVLPRVNLLPPEIEQQRKLRRLQVVLGASVLASVGVVGALTLLAIGDVGDAQDELAASKAQNSTLQAQEKEYAEVPVVYGQVAVAEAQLSEAMGQEVRWSFFLNDLSLKTPSDVWLTKLTVAQADPTAAAVAGAATAPGQWLDPGIGSITFEGKGLQHNDVAAWLVALARQKGLSQPYFTKSENELIGSESVVNFTSQATITEESLSRRYSQKAGS